MADCRHHGTAPESIGDREYCRPDLSRACTMLPESHSHACRLSLTTRERLRRRKYQFRMLLARIAPGPKDFPNLPPPLSEGTEVPFGA
jgi:hypothetical protein